MLRLADVEAEGWPAPPREVRMGLRPGDVAEILLVGPPRLGAPQGEYVRAEALVTDVVGLGMYEGETPEGDIVHFSADSVSDVISPAMGGIFDWLLRRRSEVPPPPPPSAIIPAPEKPHGFLAPVKEWVVNLFKPAPPGEVPPAAKGLFADIFASPTDPSARGMTRLEEIFSPAVSPTEPTGLPIAEQITMLFAPPAEPRTPAIQIPKVMDLTFPKEPEKAPEEAKQLTLWEAIFPEEPPKMTPLQEAILVNRAEQPTPLQDAFGMMEEPEVSLKDLFKPYAKDEVTPPKEVRAGMPAGSRRPKVLPLPPRSTVLPTPEELARGFLTRYHPIEELWEMLRHVRMDPAFQKRAASPSGASYTFETLGVCSGRPNWSEDLASFFHIPWEEIDRRVQKEYETDEEGNEFEVWVNADDVFYEIIAPLQEAVYQAFEYIKPPDLPGAFSLEWIGSDEHRCQLGLVYIEGGAPVAPGDVRPPQEAQLTEEEYERLLEAEKARMLFEQARRAMEEKKKRKS